METAMQPKHFQPGEGNSFKLGRMTMTFKTTAGQGWNAYTVCEAIEPPESGAGYHRHRTYDETFIICEGHYDFRLDGKLLKLGPGDVVFIPRGTPHGFVSGPEVGRQIIISSPGGSFDALVRRRDSRCRRPRARRASRKRHAPCEAGRRGGRTYLDRQRQHRRAQLQRLLRLSRDGRGAREAGYLSCRA
jgi:mannose-6-phosphate isomerase-like protein (cupin superfamily)